MLVYSTGVISGVFIENKLYSCFAFHMNKEIDTKNRMKPSLKDWLLYTHLQQTANVTNYGVHCTEIKIINYLVFYCNHYLSI